LQPIIIDRPEILLVVEDIVSRYIDAVNPPAVVWDISDDRDYSRNESGGGRIVLSARSMSTVGHDVTTFDRTDDAEGTDHMIVRSFVLSIKCEMDVYQERDLALDICETLRTRSLSWPAWRERWYAAGLSVIGSAPIQNVTSKWDGRVMSFATLDLDCLTAIVERDDMPQAEDFATSVEQLGLEEPTP